MQPVRMVFQKWGGRPHWEYDAVRLGSDHHGQWVGVPAGTLIARPGGRFEAGEHQVVLVPSAGWVATFFGPGGTVPCDTYVDVTTLPVDEGDRIVATDLDLDVVRGKTGRVWVDDEDEFADHRARFDYPPDVVGCAVETCRSVRDAVIAGDTPFDHQTSRRWLARLGAAIMCP